MSKYLNELYANNLLSSYEINMSKSYLCRDLKDVIANVKLLQFPVVMKILSSDILHKTDAGCVILNIKNEEELAIAYDKILVNAKVYNENAVIDGVLIQEMAEKGLELIIGVKYDEQFGPTILLGSGGIYVEVYKDITLRLLPINRIDAEKMLKEIKINTVIVGLRGTVYDSDAIIDALLKVSNMCMNEPKIEELDINPLFVYEKGKGVKGVDALIKISE